jgi:hypothetical protein
MPIFRTTNNILKDKSDADYFDENWMNYDKLQLPPKKDWDYSRELKIEDVDLWEVVMEMAYNGMLSGVYASWNPYAEFYLVILGCCIAETFYGPKAQERLKKFLLNHNISLEESNYWVEPEDMWLY